MVLGTAALDESGEGGSRRRCHAHARVVYVRAVQRQNSSQAPGVLHNQSRFPTSLIAPVT